MMFASKALGFLVLALPVAFGAEYLVGVGKDETTGKKGLGFDPSAIHPAVGDVIAFEFRSGSHSAVQSTFDNPCVGNGGFNSGVQTVADSLPVDAPGLPTIRVTVNSTDPLWFFDEAGGLCYQGAVLAVNPSAAQTGAAFKANAAKPPVRSSSTTGTGPTGSSTQTGPSQTQSTGAGLASFHISAAGTLLSMVLALW
ncbi:hypothetical protein B0H34DRAFT_682711 [Crassisporium funariophilum]|nr:hypothetical protein B0H34DRAFT_682711 [Crassisporium funariophilum]